jgi:hypothetical protein
MNVKFLNKISRPMHRAGLKLAKHSPVILTTVGVVGIVGAGVLACDATLKAVPVLAAAKSDFQMIHENVEANAAGTHEYSREDHVGDLTKVYVRTARDLTKLYGPAVLIGAASISSIVFGHRILSKRNAALTAAYAATDKAFKEYRQKMGELLGDEELSVEVKQSVTDKDGNVVHENVGYVDPSGFSQYAKFFDECNQNWQRDAESNLLFVTANQNYANDLLHKNGHIFLNEVYDLLGMERTKAGAVVGWVLGSGGDDCIDFGIYDGNNEKKRDFVNGYERSILLDFNVDGVIYDKLG